MSAVGALPAVDLSQFEMGDFELIERIYGNGATRRELADFVLRMMGEEAKHLKWNQRLAAVNKIIDALNESTNPKGEG